MSPPRPEIVDHVRARFPDARIESLAGDASSRRFYRVCLPDGDSRVLMDYGAPFEGETDDVRMARIFESAGLPVAHVEEVCGDVGCLVLEDLGHRMLEREMRRIAGPEQATDLLRRAVRLAARVAIDGSPVLRNSARAAGPALDSARFRFEMGFFVDNFAGRLKRCDCPAELVARLDDLADASAASSPPVLCHRDFHSRNLMVRPDGSLAMVDIQDARWGPDTYDLASLLRDAYMDVDEASVEVLIEEYLDSLPRTPPRDAFRRRLDVVSVQRMVKALGTFGFQIAVRGDDRYRPAVARTVGRLRRLLPIRDETRRLGQLLESAGLLED